jgi:hypothetical protein
MLPGNPQNQANQATGHDEASRGCRTSAHVLQLFDTEESLAETVAPFIVEGDAAGETLLVVATQPHWNDIVAVLHGKDWDPLLAINDERLMVFDAEDLLHRFMRRGQPNRLLFEHFVGTMVRRLSAQSGGALRIYGEMVELLAQDGNYVAAEQLEQLWNELAATTAFTLLCGYASAHFAGPDSGSALTSICRQHSKSVSHRSDALAGFLLRAERGRSKSAGTSDSVR